MGLTGPRQTVEQDFRDISSTKLCQLGAYAETPDGRGYRYSLAGAANLAPGKIVVAATVDGNFTNVTVAETNVVGATTVKIDGGGAVSANAYQDGYLTVNDATGEGISYLVRNHAALSGAGELDVQLVDPVEVAMTVDVSEVTLTKNPWAAVVISATDQADMCVGVPNVAITAAYYGWVQTKGVCSVLADEAIAIGSDVTIGTGVAGAVEASDLIGEQTIGKAIVAGVDTEYREVYLSID